jgi:hypothetical protein
MIQHCIKEDQPHVWHQQQHCSGEHHDRFGRASLFGDCFGEHMRATPWQILQQNYQHRDCCTGMQLLLVACLQWLVMSF